ncbi:uncharacterized protein LOC119499664 isoform X3 [Sebastes umbrosus]|uniref:uncharacterized protein LOC119499664 isoform X3 n=1 Tax=Sebastes umbrosus TaxID=72105 RepID=UPI00189FFC60|nr:uncharacterized protein LOC119499664 isoform X3 [Sebastes umbrosus]
MLKFESVFLCLMVIMFSRNQAALLSIHLLIMCQVSAEVLAVEHKLVSRGDSVIFTCNIYRTNVTQIIWTTGRSVFINSYQLNQTFSNFTSPRVRIDVNIPSKLNISNIQYDDAGLYRCTVTAVKLIKTLEWNLTVYEPEEISPLWSYLYILTAVAVIGFLLCVFTPAVCLYRTKTPNQDWESSTLSYAQFHVQLGKESLQVALPQPHSCAEYRMNHKQRESVLTWPDKHEVQYKAE